MIRSGERHFASIRLDPNLVDVVVFFLGSRDGVQDPVTPPGDPLFETLELVDRARFVLVRRRKRDRALSQAVQRVAPPRLLTELVVRQQTREGQPSRFFLIVVVVATAARRRDEVRDVMSQDGSTHFARFGQRNAIIEILCCSLIPKEFLCQASVDGEKREERKKKKSSTPKTKRLFVS